MPRGMRQFSAAWKDRDAMRGLALWTWRVARWAATLNVTEGDATFGQIVWRQLQRDLVASQDADVVLAHLAGGVSDQGVAVVQGHTET